MDPHDRSFVDPNDQPPEHSRNHIHFDNLQDDTNTHPIGDFYVMAESEILVANSHLLKTIREEAQEMLATVIIPFRNQVNSNVFSKEEKKARVKLERLGLNQYQIARIIQYELKTKGTRQKRQQTRNLVYKAACQKIRQYNQSSK